jgi:hypothetical protein
MPDTNPRKALEEVLEIGGYKLFTTFTIIKGPELEDPFTYKTQIKSEGFDTIINCNYGVQDMNPELILNYLEYIMNRMFRKNRGEKPIIRMYVVPELREACESFKKRHFNNSWCEEIIAKILMRIITDEELNQISSTYTDTMAAIILGEAIGCLLDEEGVIEEIMNDPTIKMIRRYIETPFILCLTIEYLRIDHLKGKNINEYLISLIRRS